MGKIFYSCSGEGRGHASRARTIIEDLKHKHTITIYAPEHAYELLYPIYKNSEVTIKRIPGLVFYYNEMKKLDYFQTVVKSIDYLIKQSETVELLCRDIEDENPDLIITDFEPTLPKAAEKLNRPYISVDHQHFLTMYDLSSLPISLQQMALLMAPSINLFYMKQLESVVSAFYFPPVKKNSKNVTQVGIFLSKQVRNITPHVGKHILVYMRRYLDTKLLDSLKNSKSKVIVYTNEKIRGYRNIKFKKISPKGFIEDLANSRALVSTAGNQLVGEALYLGKPVLSIPEPGNYEQEINGHFLQRSGGGENVYMHMIDDNTVKNFLDRCDDYIGVVDKDRLIGNDAAYEVFEKYLSPKKDKNNSSLNLAVS
jgi:uncharacterized protein (TIGR00661 family)